MPSTRYTIRKQVPFRTKSSTVQPTVWSSTSTVRCSMTASVTPLSNYWSQLQNRLMGRRTKNSCRSLIESGKKSKSALWWSVTSFSTWTRTMCPSSTFHSLKTCSTASLSIMSFWIHKSSKDWSLFWCRKSRQKETAKLSKGLRFVLPFRCSLKCAKTRVSSTSKSSRVSCSLKRPTTSDSKVISSLLIHLVLPTSTRPTNVFNKSMKESTAI